MTVEIKAVIEERAAAINKKHENMTQIQMPVAQTVLRYYVYADTDSNHYCDTDGSMAYLNCATLQQSNRSMYDVADKKKGIKCINVDTQKNNVIKGYCFEYDRDLDMIVAFIGNIDISLPMAGEPTDWEEEDRFYVDRDKNRYAVLKDGMYGYADWNNNDTLFSFSQLPQSSYICPCSSAGSTIRMPDFPDFEPVWKMFPKVYACVCGTSNLLATKYDFLSYLDILYDNRCDDDPLCLLSYNLLDKRKYTSDAKKAVEKIKKQDPNAMDMLANYYEDYTNRVKFFVLEKVACVDSVVCMRTFVLTKGPEMHEIHRFYFTRDEMLFYESDNAGSFRVAAIFKDREYWTGINLVGFRKDVVRGTVLEKLANILESVPDTKKGLYIWAMLDAPILERLWKAGYSDYVRFLLDIPKQNMLDWTVQNSCGALNEKSKSIHGMLGMTKYQADILLNKMAETEDRFLAVKVKSVLSGIMYHTSDVTIAPAVMIETSISDIDRDSFDSVIKLFDEMHRMAGEYEDIENYAKENIAQQIIGCAVRISGTWGMRTLIRSKKSILLLYSDVLEKRRRRHKDLSSDPPLDVIQQYADYLHMIGNDGMDKFKPYFKDVCEIPLLHDEAMKLYKIRQDEESALKIAEAVKRVEKFSYENDEYCIVIPTCAYDFVREGNKLGHCVESYFDKVADGETNIMFIRKKSAPDKPFFTVEISDNGTIEQIHGFSNRNLDTEPDLIPFVREWQEKRGVMLHGIDKIR